MAPPFVPFLPSNARASAGTGNRIKLVASPGGSAAPSSFTPLQNPGAGSNTLAAALAAHLQHAHPAPQSPPPATTPDQPVPTPSVHRAPRLTLHRQGERVVGITIECGCGEIIELACQY